MRKMRGRLTRGVLLLQDNAPAHTLQVAMAAATECGFEVLPHPPYSPDLAPSDSILFPKLKTNLHGRNFGSNEGVIDAVNEYLGDQDEDFYFEGISNWNSNGESASRLREIILKNSGKLFILGYSKVHEA